ncbi:MAG: DMT family transporter [Thermoplasmatota archaeon]
MTDPTRAERVPFRVVLALLAVQVCFGSLAVAAKIAFRTLAPLQVAAIRVTFGALLFVVAERLLVGSRLPSRRDLALFAGLALLGVVLNQLLFLTGLQHTTAVDATFLVATIPLFTVVIAAAFGHERLGLARATGVLVALAGVALLVGLAAIEFSRETAIGNLLVVLNALSYSFFLVLSRPTLTRHAPLTLAMWTFVFGALAIDLVALPELARLAPIAVPASAWLTLAYIVLVPTFGAYGLNSWALARAPSSLVAAFVYLQPLVAALLAVPILGESITARTLAGAALIFAGVAIVSFAPRPALHEG